jgi:hypothetical protein
MNLSYSPRMAKTTNCPSDRSVEPAPDETRPPISTVPLSHLTIAPGHSFDPGGHSTAELPVNALVELHPALRRCGAHLPSHQRESLVDGRHESATLKDRMVGPSRPTRPPQPPSG